MFVVVAEGVYVQGVVAVFSSVDAARAFCGSHRFDGDGYHRWRVVEVPVDPVRLVVSARVCPRPEVVWGTGVRMAGPHDFVDGVCSCGYEGEELAWVVGS